MSEGFFNLVFERCSNRVASFRNDFFGAYWSYSLLGHIGHVNIALGLGPFHRQIPEVTGQIKHNKAPYLGRLCLGILGTPECLLGGFCKQRFDCWGPCPQPAQTNLANSICPGRTLITKQCNEMILGQTEHFSSVKLFESHVFDFGHFQDTVYVYTYIYCRCISNIIYSNKHSRFVMLQILTFICMSSLQSQQELFIKTALEV